jgi:ABC-type phosphate transport system auxiliary subunit
MTQAREPEDFRTETERRFGHLNRRLERLEDTQISPQEFARAFERVNVDTTEIRREIADLNTKIDALSTELNGKIDTILRHLTGSGDS